MGFFRKKKEETLDAPTKEKEETPKGNLAFIKSVARYFMDFLETDFHKRKNPRRNIKFRNADNLSVGLDLKEFETFRALVWKVINDSFSESALTVKKGQYQTQMPKDLLDLVRIYCEKIDQTLIESVVNEIANDMRAAATTYPNDYDEAVTHSLQQCGAIFKKRVVLPLIQYVERPLEKLRSADENTIFLIEEELTEGLVSFVTSKVSHILNLLIHNSVVDINEILSSQLNDKEIKNFISTYFDNYRVTDLFGKIYELHRNRNILDKQDFYLYFCEVTFDKIQYPLFYVPINVITSSESLTLNFDSRVYVNKKALDFVRQEYNSQTGKKGTIAVDKRILYLAELQGNLSTEIQYILQNLTNFFELDTCINLKNPELQKARSLLVRATNSLHLALFDKSDEAIINDYEEILNLSGENQLVQQFNLLVDDFIHKNPTSFEEEIEKDWDSLATTERLMARTPIPLNEEQRQILNAIARDKCRYITIEGPPGTGKSHTITAIVFNAILKNQSVLVLSDKKEALDVVEDKISSTMDKVRLDKEFQNPILRLGQTGTTYNQILSSSVISQIETHAKAVKKDYDSLNQAIDVSLGDLKEGLEEEVDSYSGIQIHDIQEFEELERAVSPQNHFIDFDECCDIDDAPSDLEEIRNIVADIRIKSPQPLFSYDISNQLTEKVVETVCECHQQIESLKKSRGALRGNCELILNSPQALSAAISQIEQIQSVLQAAQNLRQAISSCSAFNSSQLSDATLDQLDSLERLIQGLSSLREIGDKIRNVYVGKLSSVKQFRLVTVEQISKLKNLIDSYESSRHWLFGYLGKKGTIENLNLEFKKLFPDALILKPHRKISHLKNFYSLASYAQELILATPQEASSTMNNLNIVLEGLREDKVSELLRKLAFDGETLLVSVKSLQKADGIAKLPVCSFANLEQILVSCSFISAFNSFKKKFNTISSFVDLSEFLNCEDVSYKSALGCSLDLVADRFKESHSFFVALQHHIKQLELLNTYRKKYPLTFSRAGISTKDFKTLLNNKFHDVDDEHFQKIIRYLSLKQEIRADFAALVPINYHHETKTIEELVTTQMTFLMDERVVNFTRNYKAEARVLRDIIRAKKQFPKEQFAKLKEAFPCILAGIRDYAEYIPLEPEIFDLVIIDEASQVSIAQAFPALFRAKKVVVLGDKKQFSNVKSTHARSDINREYLNRLEEVFRANISQNLSELEKLKKFNIKTSILDFFEFINNYRSRLLKHFRGYKEIIGYSNKHFYDSTLQVMKIRGVPIDSVIKFTVLRHDGKLEKLANTNLPEINFIISQLQELKKAGSKQSVGIITPHTNQQKVIYEKINEQLDREYFFETLRLKIMTFDTCQGEERDLIFYSMVATQEDDKLGYVFIRDLANVDLEEEGQLKAQRLNVGLSRARDCVHFVLSKPVDEFKGEIGNALRFYCGQLEDARKEKGIDTTESKMEENILNYFYQTPFWTRNKDRIEFTPQFKLGEYLKQLDPRYDHPKYRVDFLLNYSDGNGVNHRIVIEYDGFHEHFSGTEGISKLNYEHYYNEEDVYRQKVLEGYGYKFVRVNKFNIGKNPIETLDQRLWDITKKQERSANILDAIKKKIVGLEDGTMKECPKCKEVKTNKDFFDQSLASKYGRVCKKCKSEATESRKIANLAVAKANAESLATEGDNGFRCPRCSSRMRLRNGKFGKFYGCSRFPYCKGTRENRVAH